MLQAENQRYKEAIEAAWDRDGLPTFLRYLRDYIRSQPGGGGRPGSAGAGGGQGPGLGGGSPR